MTASAAAPGGAVFSNRLPGTRWALLFGNFAIGCGVMVVAGSLNDLTRSLGVSVALGGQLIAIGALVMCFGAPLLAGWVSGFDRRRLLAGALAWYAVGHALCAFADSHAALWPLRALTVLGAAVFTPQAAAAVGHMAQAEQRGRAITFIFLGWSLSSVLGMPMSAWVGETFGWRTAFGVVSALSVVGALGVLRTMPDGVKPAPLSMAAWGQVLRHPVLMAMVAVTALQSAGQFTLLSYLAPYAKQVLDATPGELSGLFMWFGAFGLLGNVLLARHVDRVGAARAATVAIALTAVSLALWPLATTLAATALVITPWALACFAANSAQQARLGHAAPAYAAALMALNSSAIYLGQAVGSSSGGWLLGWGGFDTLSRVGLVFVVLAIGLSVWADRRRVSLP